MNRRRADKAGKNDRHPRQTARPSIDWEDEVEPTSRPRLLRLTGLGLVAGCCAIGVALGLARLETYVRTLPVYRVPVYLEFAETPPWFDRLRLAGHVLQDMPMLVRVATAGGRRFFLLPGQNLLDEELVRQVGRALEASGWVERVRRVEKQFGGRVRVWCDFRRPVALVEWDKTYYLVDAKGTRLPGRYGYRADWMVIRGAAEPPPPIGQTWDGKDVCAGAAVAALLVDRPYARQVRAILVGNYGGRRDPYLPHIELVTDRDGSRIRWGRAIGEEVGLEPTAAQKLALLDKLYRESGRIDRNLPWVDISYSRQEVIVPAAALATVANGSG